jgi:DNA-binding NarL/FixJ family response regulator
LLTLVVQMAKIRIALTDDHPLYLEGLELLLKKEKDLEVAGTFNNGPELLEFCRTTAFEILLLDLHLPSMDGLQIAEQLQKMQHSAKVIMLTMQRGGRYQQKTEKLNIKGYLLKNVSIEELKEAILKVNAGGTCFSDDNNKLPLEEDLLLKSSVILDGKPDTILSEREKEILVLVCKEYSSAQIAEKLFISTGTVDTHRKNILVKIGTTNTIGLVKYALKYGLLDE